MATLDTVITKTYVISLTQEEYDWLSKMTQNPITFEESKEEREFRCTFWNTLHPIHIGPPVSRAKGDL